MMKRKTLYELFNEILDDYNVSFLPFSAIYQMMDDASIEMPDWFTSDFAQSTDLEYVMQHAGSRIISNMVLRMYDFQKKMTPSDPEGTIITNTLMNVAYILYNKYFENWKRVHDAMFADYNPIQNYDSTEEITRSGDDKVSVNTDNKQTSKVSAFNASALQDNQEVSNSGLASNNYSKTDYNSKVKTTKYGNIGVTTSQQMIESEIALRQRNFVEMIMNDVDNIFVSNLYFMKD